MTPFTSQSTSHLSRSLRPLAAAVLLLLPSVSFAQDIVSRTLTDAIYSGDGVIDLLKDISGAQLQQYFTETGGLLLLGADVNEDNSGNESSTSLGIAIKQVQLSISTTAGDFTFSDFFTSTTAMLREAGSTTASEYYTMFGQGGSSTLTGAENFSLARFDDVMWLENVAITGTITGAQLHITFLETPNKAATAAESFFDFSGGFEDFALLSTANAALLESANIGIAAAPSTVTYATADPVTTAIAAALPPPPGPTDPGGGTTDGGGGVIVPPAAPSPPLLMLAGMAWLVAWRFKRQSVHGHTT